MRLSSFVERFSLTSKIQKCVYICISILINRDNFDAFGGILNECKRESNLDGRSMSRLRWFLLQFVKDFFFLIRSRDFYPTVRNENEWMGQGLD